MLTNRRRADNLVIVTNDTIGSTRPGRAVSPIRKPLPPELFEVYDTNAEMRWEAMRGQGHQTPTDRFFVRDHTSTPLIDARTWRLRLHGSGLARPCAFGYDDLLRMPDRTISAVIECTGNGRAYFASQQGRPTPGSQWKLGGVGAASWRGVPLSAVLERAGVTRHAIDVMPAGLDPEYVDDGRNQGRVRRPMPIGKAMDDVLLAYEMNGEPLLPDHGFPVRVVVPGWVGIASIKWVGDIEVSAEPLSSPWNTDYYRLDTGPLTRQIVKSAFELGPAFHGDTLHGRSWSGDGGIRRVEVSTDAGATWRRARLHGPADPTGWQRWDLPWRPAPGSYTLLARATDQSGTSQPDVAPHNPLGYLFGAVVRHHVTVT